MPPALRAPLDPAAQTWMEQLDVASYDAIHELPACRLRAFQVGRLSVMRADVPTGVSIPILAYALEVPDHLVLVDCGLSSRWAGAGAVHAEPDDSPSPGVPYVPELDGPSLAAQLAAASLTPDRLVCTHLHEDHASGAAELGLTLEAAALEIERLQAPDAGVQGYPVEELASVPMRVIDLDPERPLGPFLASAEVVPGVLAVDTAGHTPGSISVLACVGPAWALICGDAVYPRLDQPDSPAYLGAARIRRALDDVRALRVFAAHDTAVLRSGATDGWIGGETGA